LQDARDEDLPDPRPNERDVMNPSPAPAPGPDLAAEGRLTARPGAPGAPGDAASAGTYRLGLTTTRDGLIHVPAAIDAGKPAPLVILLHGAGGDAEHGISLLRGHAEHAGLLLLAVASRRSTWDVIQGGFGPDVEQLDRALAWTFARHAVDATRLAIAGFSDGATYALSIGLGNGDLFTDIVAFSPGYMAPSRLVGRPRVFITHGVQDTVLPIDRCGRRVAAALRSTGHDVTYKEFPDGHTVPAELRRAAVAWFDGDRESPSR
jgi:phospholipase/carboxylesterase